MIDGRLVIADKALSERAAVRDGRRTSVLVGRRTRVRFHRTTVSGHDDTDALTAFRIELIALANLTLIAARTAEIVWEALAELMLETGAG